MEKLVERLLIKLRSEKQKEGIKLDAMKISRDEKMILFHSGRIISIEYCMEELYKLLEYYHAESPKN